MRPNDPIPFIASFMLKNKHTMKKLDEFVKLQTIDNEEKELEIEIDMGDEESEMEEDHQVEEIITNNI